MSASTVYAIPNILFKSIDRSDGVAADVAEDEGTLSETDADEAATLVAANPFDCDTDIAGRSETEAPAVPTLVVVSVAAVCESEGGIDVDIDVDGDADGSCPSPAASDWAAAALLAGTESPTEVDTDVMLP